MNSDSMRPTDLIHPRSLFMSRHGSWLLSDVLSAAITGALVFMVGIILTPRRSVARTAFTVDWQKMPSVPDDASAENARDLWKRMLVLSLTDPQAKTDLTPILDCAAGREPALAQRRRPSVADLRAGLRLSIVSEGEDTDRFIVEVADHDRSWALAIAACVADEYLAQIKGHATVGAGAASVRSYGNVEEVDRQEQALAEEHGRLRRSGGSQHRLAEIERELASLQSRHFEAGLGLFVNLAKLLGDDEATKVVEPARIVPRHSRGWGPMLMAGLSGTAAGVGRRWWRDRRPSVRAKSSPPQTKPPVIPWMNEEGKPPRLPPQL